MTQGILNSGEEDAATAVCAGIEQRDALFAVTAGLNHGAVSEMVDVVKPVPDPETPDGVDAITARRQLQPAMTTRCRNDGVFAPAPAQNRTIAIVNVDVPGAVADLAGIIQRTDPHIEFG